MSQAHLKQHGSYYWFEEGVKKGMDLGQEEGYTVAKEGFDSIVKRLKAREALKNTSRINSGTQTDLTITTGTTSVSKSMQTNSTSYSTPSTQTTTPYTISHPTMDCSVQTNPSSIQMSCPIIKSSSSSPTLLQATFSVSTTTMGIQVDTTTPQLLKTNPPTRIATLQCPESPGIEKKAPKNMNISQGGAGPGILYWYPVS